MTNQEQYEEMCEKAKKYDELKAQRASTGYWEYVHYDPDYLVYSGTCTACKKKHESTDNVGKLPFCPHCGAQMTFDSFHSVNGTEPFLNKTIHEIGIPLLHIVGGRVGMHTTHYELTGDVPEVFEGLQEETK